MGKKVDFVVADLISRIFRNHWPSGRLPTQRELASEYGVSRVTVQSAIEELTRIGAVVSRQGSGTFIRENLRKNPLLYNSLTRTPYAEMTSSVLSLAQEPASVEDSRAFRIPDGSPVWKIVRQRSVAQSAVQLERSVMPVSLFPVVPSTAVEGSIQEFVESAGYRISHYMTSYAPTIVTREDARTLGCHRGTAAMAIRSRGVLTDGRVFEQSDIIAVNYTVSYISLFDREVHEARIHGFTE